MMGTSDMKMGNADKGMNTFDVEVLIACYCTGSDRGFLCSAFVASHGFTQFST